MIRGHRTDKNGGRKARKPGGKKQGGKLFAFSFTDPFMDPFRA